MQYFVVMLNDLTCGSSSHCVFDKLLEARETMESGGEEGEVERMTSTGLTNADMKGFSDAKQQENLPTPQTLE
ncbi:hypothetical protein AV530_015487 [Patagioenas fasciata monilis]|uniref:Uncharacterized protein n=1 Tax=Patagioenas fasciata monilis TaxID=372326 RepID=A0A1V4KRR7_PATFA|nr:hypothetical protein AV530_015487 [Patagioenas fasciata monilis]